jgi:hypothetical protein
LAQALKADAQRPKHARRSAKALLVQIQAQGYQGGYSAVTDYVRAWRENAGQSVIKAFVPLNFEFGEAFQFDWSDEGLMVGGVYYKIQVAHLKLCASRAFWLVAYPSQGHEMLFDAHTQSFHALGGVTRRGIYDNMKTAVDKVKKGKGRIVNARFTANCGQSRQISWCRSNHLRLAALHRPGATQALRIAKRRTVSGSACTAAASAPTAVTPRGWGSAHG